MSKPRVEVLTFRVWRGPGTTVYNLKRYTEHTFSVPPRQAVIAAYAQERGDFNTMRYETRYGALIKQHGDVWTLGDWAALEPARGKWLDSTTLSIERRKRT